MKKKLAHHTSKLALAAAAPMFLAETDLNANIAYYTDEITLSSGNAWSFYFSGSSFSYVCNYFFEGINGGLFASYSNGTLIFQNTTTDASNTTPGQAIPTTAGNTIDGNLDFGNYAEFLATSPKTYYGFSVGKGAYYGWAEISTETVNNNPSLTIHRWAIEDDGSGITVGAVPEPKDFALGLGGLAIGAAAVMHRRRKEKANNAA